MLGLLSKYIYPKSKHFAPQPSWSRQWLWGGGLGGHEAQRQELSRHTHPREVGLGPNPVGTFKPVKDFGPSTGEQAWLPGGGGEVTRKEREGIRFVL